VARKASHNPTFPLMYVKPAISKTQASPVTAYLPMLNHMKTKDNETT
jgi:hypothetical protein